MNSYTPSKELISVVVPIYKEENNVQPLVDRLSAVFRKLDVDWELIFALDPGPDQTQVLIENLIEKGFPIRLIVFSRRIGKPLSLLAGLDHALGAACVIIDADLQDPPELIEGMVQKWRAGAEVVIARRTSRKGEKWLYLKSAKLFYRILDRISDVKVPKDTGDFRLIDAKVLRWVCKFRERHAFLRGMSAYVGFKTDIIDYDRDPRLTGKAQISLLGAVNIAMDGIVPFSRTPVRLIFVAGLVITLLGLAGFLLSFIAIASTTSVRWMGAVIIFSGMSMTGILLTALGIIGEYLVRTYEESRERPLYIIESLRESDSLARRWANIGE